MWKTPTASPATPGSPPSARSPCRWPCRASRRLASADKQPVTVGALAFVTASGIQYGQVAAGIVLSILPTFALALYAQRYLVEGLSLGAVKG